MMKLGKSTHIDFAHYFWRIHFQSITCKIFFNQVENSTENENELMGKKNTIIYKLIK